MKRLERLLGLPRFRARTARPRAVVVCGPGGAVAMARLCDLLAPDWEVDVYHIGPGAEVSDPQQRRVHASSLAQAFPAAMAISASQPAALVVVTGNGAPALLFGALIRKTSGCPLLLVEQTRTPMAGTADATLTPDASPEAFRLALAQAAQHRPGRDESLDTLIDAARSEAARLHHRPALPPSAAPDSFDIVMFWKQNDGGLFGRRADMLMAHLLASGRVGRVLQFDAPMRLADLRRMAETAEGPADPAGLQLGTAVANQFAFRDSGRHFFRTFLWDEAQAPGPFPQIGRTMRDYPAFVAREMAACGIRPENAFAWVYPVVYDFPAIAAAIPFCGVIGDIKDDQRTFESDPERRAYVAKGYKRTLPLCDLTFTNCAALATSFATPRRTIHVVPNGTDLPPPETARVPETLACLPRPIAGYVGNLRERINWPLLAETARLLPDVTFAMVGGDAQTEDVAALRALPNVVFTGAVPYAEIHDHFAAFDVALLPHQVSDVTAHMNPLKIYTYFAHRRPIVATPVANIDEALRPYIRFAADPEGFARAIRDALRQPLDTGPAYDRALDGVTWTSRTRRILAIIDQWRAGRRT